MRWDIDIVSIRFSCQESQIFLFPVEEKSSLCTAVSGMGMKAVGTQSCPYREWNFGERK
jgi:hypothetical protein